MLKKLNFVFALGMLVMASCGDDETSEPKVDLLEATEVRIVATVSAAGITETDKFFVAGSFKAPNDWKENGIFELKKRDDGKFYIDITAEQVDGATLNFKIQRNGLWQYVEKNESCAEIDNRQITIGDNLGEEFPITIVAFRNTGTCPD